MAIKTLLIDDEPLASAELKLMLQDFEDVEVIGIAENHKEAAELLKAEDPDLIFLDIHMPEMDGFELLESLEEVPQVIFVTAHDQFALQAYEANALDYLLKPVNPERLSESIAKVRKFLTPSGSSANSDTLDINRKIFVKDGEKVYFVPISEVYLIESVGNYARLFYQDKKPLLHRSLNYLEERLPQEHFFRVNRQQIINLSFIKEIHPFFNSSLRLEMESGDMIDVSQRQSTRFREVTGI